MMMKPVQVRAGLYTRVSTDQQATEGRSPESQLDDLLACCERRGWTPVRIYQDEGLSGRREDRSGLQQLMADVRAGQLDVVAVYSLSRFHRKLDHLLAAMHVFKQCGVEFVSISEHLDFTTTWGKLTLSILGTLAEIYVDGLSELTSRGKLQRAKQGFYNGSIPTGYCKGLCTRCTDPNGPGYCPRVGQSPLGDGEVLVPHPLESQAVRLAFEWYATGAYSDADIAYLLNQHQHEVDGESYPLRPKPRRNGQAAESGFSKDTVRDLLRRRFYTGVVEYRGGEGVAEERRKHQKAQAVYDGQHAALVNVTLFNDVQTVRQRRSKRAHRGATDRQRVYPLSGLLYSWPGRSKMRSVSNGSGQRFYRDRANIGRSTHDLTSRSSQPNVEADLLEQQAQAVLDTLTLPAAWQQRILAYLVTPEGGLAEVERERRHLLAQFERLKELYGRGDYTAAQYQQEKARLEQQLSALLVPVDMDHDKVQALLADLPSLLDQATPADLKDLFAAVFQRVYVEDDALVRLVVYPPFPPHLSDPDGRIIGPADDVADETLTISAS